MRIASLLASGTEIVCDLGLQDRLVAISHECDYPPDALNRPRLSRPRFDPRGLSSGEIDAAVRRAMLEHGSVYEIDRSLLLELRPDLIIAQAVCEVCAVPTSLAQTVADLMESAPRILSLDAHRVADIFAGIVAVGTAAGAAPAAARRAAELEVRVRAVGSRVAARPRPRVLAIEWLDPPFVPGHWTPEMIELAGGENLAGEVGRPSRQVGWEALMGHDPDVLVLMPCGYGLEQSQADAGRFAARLEEVAPRAIDTGRAFVVDGSAYFNRSGPRTVTGVEILGALFHPELFPDISLDGKAARFRPARQMSPR